MRDWIRNAFCHILPTIQTKSIWTKDEQELIALLEHYISLNQTTKDEVETFLRKNGIRYRVETYKNSAVLSVRQQSDTSSEILRCILPGRTVWESFLPHGSQYQVEFQFLDEVLVNIEVFHFVYGLS